MPRYIQPIVADEPTPSHVDRRFDRAVPVIDVTMGFHDGSPPVTVRLTRVPTIGEEIDHEGGIFRVINVLHTSLDPDGRAALGFRAFVDVVEVPDAGWLNPPERPKPKVRKRRRSKANRSGSPRSGPPAAAPSSE